jgi:hypothetical protein
MGGTLKIIIKKIKVSYLDGKNDEQCILSKTDS